VPVAAQGAVAAVAGALLLALPSPGLRTVGIIVGAALLASAAAEVVAVTRHREDGGRPDRLLAVAALATAGTVVLVWPSISQLALLYAVGASAVVLAVVEVAALSTRGRGTREQWLGALTSIVAFVFGIALLAHPGSGLSVAIDLLGVYLIVLGALRMLQAAAAWRRRRHAG
jgi:uncharacterized membrane protein HdeD (DUF308 family)